MHGESLGMKLHTNINRTQHSPPVTKYVFSSLSWVIYNTEILVVIFFLFVCLMFYRMAPLHYTWPVKTAIPLW